MIFLDLPIKEASLSAMTLLKDRFLLWAILFAASFIFVFSIVPQRIQIEDQRLIIAQMKMKIQSSQKTLKEREIQKGLIQEKEPFFMERLVREEFNLVNTEKNNSPNQKP